MNNINYLRLCLALSLLISLNTSIAQTVPPEGLSGEALQTWLRDSLFVSQHQTLGYDVARQYLYNNIDNQNDSVTCVYSGYKEYWVHGQTSFALDSINCEHTVPQSFFNYTDPLKSDLHHLYPTLSRWNSTRSNNPFGDIQNHLSTKWMRSNIFQASIPSSNIDEYSEYVNSTFEPREDHKGNLARAIFYAYTMCPTDLGHISDVGDLMTFYKWHLADPVDTRELERNDTIEFYQGNRNPFIDDSSLVRRAWIPDSLTITNYATDPIYISEYVEGSGFNKALELSNKTGEVVDLTEYSIYKQANGSGGFSKLHLTGELQPNEVYTIVHPSADPCFKSKADLLYSGAAITFNGNDPIALARIGEIIDRVGVQDDTSIFGEDLGLVRLNTLSSPNSAYDINEWEVRSQDDCSTFGDLEPTPQAILPIELLHFQVKAERNSIDLTWITALEENACCFDIERSMDGVHFEKITRMETKGIALNEAIYHFNDENLTKNKGYYYRLKMIDLNNSFQYSDVEYVYFEGNDKDIIVYPNPFSEQFTIELESRAGESYTLQLTNTLGQIIEQKNSSFSNTGVEKINFQTDVNLAKGIYFLTIIGAERKVIALVKK